MKLFLVGWLVGGFQIAKSEGNKKKEKKNHQNLVCVAMNMQSWLKICDSYMAYSHIWLNPPIDDCHFSNIFLWDDHQLGYITKSLKKNWFDHVKICSKITTTFKKKGR
jgi:hypothetical protein